jgi:hypothetical protein
MKNKDLIWIGLALAAGYYLSQQKKETAATTATVSNREVPQTGLPSGRLQPVPVLTDQDLIPQRPQAIAGHHCACTRRIYRWNSVL